MRLLFTTILCFITLVACQENKPKINPRFAKYIIANSSITDRYETQYFNLFYSSHIEDSTKQTVAGATIIVTQADTNYAFNDIGNGVYASANPFMGIAGQKLEADISLDTTESKGVTTMPHPIIIDSLFLTHEEPSAITIISLSTQTSVDQYFRFNFYDGIVDSLTQDTIWLEHEFSNSNTILNIESGPQDNAIIKTLDYSIYDTNRLVKIEVDAFSNDMAEYLIKLNAYNESQSTTSLFLNPPLFYTNNVYGLFKGMYTTRFITKI